MTTLLVGLLLASPVMDQLDGAEIGDAQQFVAFQSLGKYLAEREDPKGKTVARGKWEVGGDKLTVRVSGCRGPACATLGKSYSARVKMVAERAMLVRSSSEASPLPSGSYYCRFQGCEKRTGVLVRAHGARPVVLRYLVDFLIDKNRPRDVTVVWWGHRTVKKLSRTQLTYCQRDGERGREGADLVAKDLAELTWLGPIEVKPGPKDCLHDVELLVADGVQLPSRR